MKKEWKNKHKQTQIGALTGVAALRNKIGSKIVLPGAEGTPKTPSAAAAPAQKPVQRVLSAAGKKNKQTNMNEWMNNKTNMNE